MSCKFNYYIAEPIDSLIIIDEFYSNIENNVYDKINEKFFHSQGLKILCNGSNDQISEHARYINSRKVIKFNGMSKIFDFLFDKFFLKFKQDVADYIMFNTEGVFDVDVDETYLGKIFNRFLIVREHKKTKTLSFVKKTEIKSCYFQVALSSQDEFFEKIQNHTTFLTSDVVKKFDEKFKEFTNRLEYLIGDRPNSHIHLSADNNSNFSIFKKGSKSHKSFKNLLDETPTENGYIYEWPMSSFRQYILRNIINQKPIGCTFRIHLSEYNEKTKEIPFSKVYGFMILPTTNVVEFQQIDAQMVLDSFLVDVTTGEKTLKPDARTIYCGLDEKDEICGFELV